MSNSKKLLDLASNYYSYPKPSDPDFQSRIYKKREFFSYRIPERPKIESMEEISEFRDGICAKQFSLQKHQSFLSNFICPQTPYRGLLVFHGTGTGKCIHPSEKVLVNNSYIRIRELWDNNRNLVHKINSEEWSQVTNETTVISINSEGQLVNGKCTRLFRMFVNEEIVKIQLENNTRITVTKAHKMLTNNGWKHPCVSDEVLTLDYEYTFNETMYLHGWYIVRGTKATNDRLAFQMNGIDTNKLLSRLKSYIIENDLIITNINYTNVLQAVSSLDIHTIDYSSRESLLEGLLDATNNRYELMTASQKRLKSDLLDLRKKRVIHRKVIGIQTIDYRGYVYDLEIEKHHNYVANSIICHNTCASIAIAEGFKDMITRYGTKIYVLVSGPLIKENWRSELLKCTGKTYLKQVYKPFVSQAETQKNEKNALSIAMQYYKFMSYRSFYRKVLGEKIVDKRTAKGDRIRVTYRKTDDGEFERDVSMDRIYNLNNSVIIVDEAHNLTGNAYGEALMKIIKASTNLRIILLTATPMKNLADDIIELLNFIRPPEAPILREKVFTSNKNHEMEFKPGGVKYLKDMTRGYVSSLRGADPLTFAIKSEIGEVPKGLLFTKLTRCKMLDFQLSTYNRAIERKGDTLDRRSEAVANFTFPGLSEDGRSIVGYYGREGIAIVRNQLKSFPERLNSLLSKMPGIKCDPGDTLIYLSNTTETITGAILRPPNLKHFSIKFSDALTNLNKLTIQNGEARTAFIYSNLVKTGIEMFQEVLLQNGYLEYQESSNYIITSRTRCYYCGINYGQHKDIKNIQAHNFHPAVFITITGRSGDDINEAVPENKQNILKTIFSSADNIDGRYIKFALGSKVMNEGISLANIREIHILDVYFTLGKVYQVEGRGLRHCLHYMLMLMGTLFPSVSIYKYAVSLDGCLSSEEELYKKAELKYILIKRVERILREISIDCPLNRNGNIFTEEVEKFKNCRHPLKSGDQVVCPPICDFESCEFRCDDQQLNNLYFDKAKGIYRPLGREEIDSSTFTHQLVKSEINEAKQLIKNLYRSGYAYTIDKILSHVKKSNSLDTELFDEFFVYKALDELLPVSEDDFNNFNDVVYDKFNKPGYLIYAGNYYIFQPFNQSEISPMYCRKSYDRLPTPVVYLDNYLSNTMKKDAKTQPISETNGYDFDSVMEYYDRKEDFAYIGVIDKEDGQKKGKGEADINDVFKIRSRREKVLEKRRGTGIPSFKGAVCPTSKGKKYLESVLRDLKVKFTKDKTRVELCNIIKDELLTREKFATGNKKLTYMMVPSDHPVYKFPYNLEDRLETIKNKVKELNVTMKTTKKKYNKASQYYGREYYVLTVTLNKNTVATENEIKKLGGIKTNNGVFIFTID